MGDRLPSFEYHLPATLPEAIGLLGGLDGALVLQGGTDLLVAAKLKGVKPKHLVSLRKLRPTLGRITQEDGRILIGTSVTFDELENSGLIHRRLPALHEAIRMIGSQQIRNAGTIGGNLCNASPAADSVPPLFVLGAVLKVQGPGGVTEIPVEKFFTGPGKTVLKKGEILTDIAIPPLEPGSGAASIKMGRRVNEDISIVSAAAFVSLSGKMIKAARVSLGSVAPTVLRAYKTEEFLKGKALTDDLPTKASVVAMGECSPITDIRSSASYRKKMVGVLTRTVIREAIRRASSGGN